MMELAVGIDPDFVMALINRGVAMENLGNIEDAIESYERALELDPENEMARVNLEKARSRYVLD